MRLPSPTRGDAAIAVATAVFVWVTIAPTLRARAFRVLSESAVADVTSLRNASLASRRAAGAWPDPAPAGLAPPGLLPPGMSGDSPFVRDGYVLEWSSLSTVTYVEVPAPPVESAPGDAPPDEEVVELQPRVRDAGTIVVHSSNGDLLAALLREFGADASYVRDSTWTLVVPDPGG